MPGLVSWLRSDAAPRMFLSWPLGADESRLTDSDSTRADGRDDSCEGFASGPFCHDGAVGLTCSISLCLVRQLCTASWHKNKRQTLVGPNPMWTVETKKNERRTKKTNDVRTSRASRHATGVCMAGPVDTRAMGVRIGVQTCGRRVCGHGHRHATDVCIGMCTRTCV